MQAANHTDWLGESHWRRKEAARRRAHELRDEAIDAFWARLVAALRLRRQSQRSNLGLRVARCD
jgi:hypothetical protein